MRTVSAPTSEAAIWRRISLSESNGLSPETARGFLALGFTKADKNRMNELARKNQEEALSAAERQELEGYVKVGDVLSLLHLKARKAFKCKKRPRGRKDG